VKRKQILIISGILVVLCIVALVNRYLALYVPNAVKTGEVVVVAPDEYESFQNTEPESVAFRTEVVATGLTIPWSIVFESDSHVYITERTGAVREIVDGVLSPQPLYTFTVSQTGEEGLMGMAINPSDSSFYFCYAYDTNSGIADKVVRLTKREGKLTDETVILDSIPAAQYHAGCRLAFGPDTKLYITTGDATKGDIAQDLNSLGGKILRVNADGSIPGDNPFPNSPIWSYGHRNPQGIAWSSNGILYETEHGPSGFDGPGGGDEVNIIKKGANYGWPLVSHDNTREGTEAPKLTFTPAFAPASGMVYTGTLFPQFRNNFFFGGIKGEGIMRVMFDSNNTDIVAYEKLDSGDWGRIRDVAESPDGTIYFSTSNRDGRGKVLEGDDKIISIVPVSL